MTDLAVDILYQDASLLVINKPSGLLTLPDGYQTELAHVRSLLEPKWGRLWIVHRLDKGTSGILLLARTPEAHKALNEQFSSREIQKEYHLLAMGLPNLDHWDVSLPLRLNSDRQHRTVIDLENGKPAITIFDVLKKMENAYSLLAAHPQTGYTHQIRAHLSACGLALCGDPLYDPKPHPMMRSLQITPPTIIFPASRLGLHAYSIHFKHPSSNKDVTIIAPYPKDFSDLLHLLDSNK